MTSKLEQDLKKYLKYIKEEIYNQDLKEVKLTYDQFNNELMKSMLTYDQKDSIQKQLLINDWIIDKSVSIAIDEFSLTNFEDTIKIVLKIVN
ncbi:4260_t:CDS:1, partial [Dentiscutata erythropus]